MALSGLTIATQGLLTTAELIAAQGLIDEEFVVVVTPSREYLGRPAVSPKIRWNKIYKEDDEILIIIKKMLEHV